MFVFVFVLFLDMSVFSLICLYFSRYVGFKFFLDIFVFSIYVLSGYVLFCIKVLHMYVFIIDMSVFCI